MPRFYSEISSGAAFSRSSQEGQIADSQSRVFRVLLSQPGEVFYPQAYCGVFVGDVHPYNSNIYCAGFDAKYEGDSRMVLVVTFKYESRAGSSGGGEDPQSRAPDVRPALVSTGTATIESPVRSWRKVPVAAVGNPTAGASGPAVNSANDMYDGISKLEPIITISIEQYYAYDPLVHSDIVGCINSFPVNVGQHSFASATVMLRSIQSTPVVETWGSAIFRGWKVVFEFMHKRNTTSVWDGLAERTVDIGWDIAVPQTGFNCNAFNPAGASASQDVYGQPLKHDTSGKIVLDGGVPSLDGIAVGERVRAMVKVFAYTNGGASQTPSAQPIALNDDGTPRKVSDVNPVIVYRYRIYEEYDFNSMGLRLDW